MPRMEYRPTRAPALASAVSPDQLTVLYAVLLDEVNAIRRACGLPERTADEFAQTQVAVYARWEHTQRGHHGRPRT